MRALITGATGLVGSRLVRHLAHPHVLVRDVTRAAGLGDVVPFAWDAAKDVPAGAMDGIDAVFHLAGEPVATGRWNASRREGIERSRVEGTRRVVEAIRRAPMRPKVLVSASAVGIYGSRGEEVLTEVSEPGEGFLADVCRAWEAEALAATELGVRVVTARIGVVLSRDGGALAAMLPIFRVGLGGPVGTGRQWVPWVHVSDTTGLLLHAARCEDVKGAFNVCAPEPITNADLSRSLGRALGRPSFLSAPASLMRLAVGGLADVVLASQRVLPSAAHRTGYKFRVRDVDDATRLEAAERSTHQEPS
jgi:uncharacterized protein